MMETSGKKVLKIVLWIVLLISLIVIVLKTGYVPIIAEGVSEGEVIIETSSNLLDWRNVRIVDLQRYVTGFFLFCGVLLLMVGLRHKKKENVKRLHEYLKGAIDEEY